MRHGRRRDATLKRALDVAGAVTGLIALAPVMALIAVSLWVSQGRPILFRQVRPGVGGRPFTMVKFRSMRAARQGEIWYMSDGERLTRVGRFLRSTSLDEIPELWNVLTGDMSLVGPRPLLVEYLAQYTESESRRHEMRPGITGWAVVNGRNNLRFHERLRLDVWYVDHWSLRLDVQILALTLLQVLRRTDVSTTEDLSLGFPLPGLMDVRTADPSGSAATIESRATNRIDDAETPES